MNLWLRRGGRRVAGRVATAFMALVFAGCATVAPDVALPLTAAGRMAVRVDAGPLRPAQSLSAAFEWRGTGERGELALLSPLGAQVALARWSPGVALLITPEGQTRFGTLDELAERALGERVPLVAWPDWLAGRPWPGAASVPLEAAAGAPADAAAPAAATSPATSTAPAGFEQLGWRVDLSRRSEGRIEARRAAPPLVTVRIVLEQAALPRP